MKSDDDNEADVVASADNAADVVIAADNATDVDENAGDDASDLETEPTVPKTSTTEKVAVHKTSKKRGPRGPYKKTQTIVSLLFSLLNLKIKLKKSFGKIY